MFRLLALAVVVGLGVVVIRQILPDVQRYLRLRSM
jgi:hypothetical protein